MSTPTGSWTPAVEQLRRRVLADIPGLSAKEVGMMLASARVDRPRTALQLNSYLDTHRSGLLEPDPLCPLGLNRLALVLACHGYPVTPPACPGCDRRVLLRHRHRLGRVCSRCDRIAHPKVCTTCGEVGTASFSRFGRELLCRNCFRKDTRSHKECGKCGRMRALEQRGENGELLCTTCAPRPLHTCIDCGRRRPAHARTPQGPVCQRCYSKHQKPRLCGVCGRTAPIVIRAKGDQPDYCQSCWNREYGKRRRANRPAKPSRPPRPPNIRRGQQARPQVRKQPQPKAPKTPKGPKRPALPSFATCVLCQRDRSISVHWPIGPICDSCYPTAREHPEVCAGCDALAVLIGKDAVGQMICGPCAGSKLDYRCQRCGVAGRAYSAGHCFRCCVQQRLTEVLGGPSGQIPPHLIPLRQALLAAQKPRSVLVWLNRSTGAQLLAQLASHPEVLTHAVLDSIPPSPPVHFVRRLLTDTGVLPQRFEHLERVKPWLEEHLKTRPTQHATLIRPYVRWHLMHRARQRAQRYGDSTGAAHALRKRIKTVLDFLEWLAGQGIDLTNLSQHDLDRWLVGRPSSYWSTIRGFLHWAAGKHLTPANLTIPTRKNGQPKNYVETKDYLEQLRRCLHDPDLPIDVRAAGSLILLYGLHTTDILGLRRDQLMERDAEHYLQLRSHALLLPPPLAGLLWQLPFRRVNRTIVQPPVAANPLLFPGYNDARHIDSYSFGARLIKHGITPLAGRNTARLTLAADLPAAVLAEVIGIHNVTAMLWADRSRRNWHNYLAARRSTQVD